MKGILLAVLVLATAPLYADYTPFYLGLLTEVLVFGLFALAFDVMLGHAGVMSLGHSAFLGVAAYTTGLLLARWRAPIELSISAMSTISGSLATLSIVVVPRARTDAVRTFSVAPTLGKSSRMSAPVRPSGASATR